MGNHLEDPPLRDPRVEWTDPPGRYRLVLISPGYANRGVPVELRAGEYEDVDVTLFK
ncbi:MAG: carboxypeptidase regulatory-like domain-containing protein [bacterium]|nr:carboxypeptidase regulatory-like domain-containing protein [bacterium]